MLERINETGRIFHAWSDEPWVNEGAAVRVSLVGFSGKDEALSIVLDGKQAGEIYADLTAGTDASGGMDLTKAKLLLNNRSVSFEGTKKYGDFDILGELARSWLFLPNPHGKPNSDVVKPWMNGRDITTRLSDTWIIDFGVNMSENEAALYEAPFSYVLEHVKNNRKDKKWWLHERPRPELRNALKWLKRYIATPRVAKHRFFVFLPNSVLPDTRLNVITR